jgi:hypothetical protein
MKEAQTYSNAVHEETKWWGTFPIEVPLKIGEIIKQDKEGGMSHVGDIQTKLGAGVIFRIESSPVSAAVTWSHHASRNRAATAEGGATAATGVGAQAAVKVSFSAIAGFVLDYVAGTYHRLVDVDAAKRAVLGLAKNGEWERDYVLVTEMIEASPATVIASSAQNSSILLNASVALPANVGGINLADPKFGFSSSSSTEGVYQSVSARSFPLYHCIKVYRKWWGGRSAELQAVANVNIDKAFTDDPFEDENV